MKPRREEADISCLSTKRQQNPPVKQRSFKVLFSRGFCYSGFSKAWSAGSEQRQLCAQQQ